MKELISSPLSSWCVFASCVAAGKVYVGNKQEIAENRIPELNTYMKVRLILIINIPECFLYLQCLAEILAPLPIAFHEQMHLY